MHTFFADGMVKIHLPWVAEPFLALLHRSLFLFFAGLAISLFNINQSVFRTVIWWIGIFSTLYGWITVMPIFLHDSPYYAPLSSLSWSIHNFMPYTLFSLLAYIISGRFGSPQTWERFLNLSKRYGDRMADGVWKAAEETALEQSSEIVFGTLNWTIGALSEDDTLENFFEAIPGLLI